MAANNSLYQIGISGVSALLIGGLGGLVALAWAYALGGAAWPAGVVASIAAAWGALVVHLTPTGGTITENRTTVNYAVWALHAWYAFFLCVVALVILALRSWAL